jgi:hypothetical protein
MSAGLFVDSSAVATAKGETSVKADRSQLTSFLPTISALFGSLTGQSHARNLFPFKYFRTLVIEHPVWPLSFPGRKFSHNFFRMNTCKSVTKQRTLNGDYAFDTERSKVDAP